MKRWQHSEVLVMGGLAILVGLIAGIGIWVFKRMIDLANWLAIDLIGGQLAHLGRWYIVLIPILDGLSVGLLTQCLITTEHHRGVAGIIEAVALAGGRLRYKRIPAKVVASAISIGSGASIGSEDPSVQIGSNIGSMFGQWLQISTMGLARKGIRLEHGRDVEVMQTLKVSEVMQNEPFTLPDTDNLLATSEKLYRSHHHDAAVVDIQGNRIGMLTIQDLDRVAPENWQTCTTGEACTRQLLVSHPEETIGAALSRMSIRDFGPPPIGKKDSPRQLHYLIASLRRKREKIIPNGDTRVFAGDILVIKADEFVRQEILNLCKVSEGSHASPSN